MIAVDIHSIQKIFQKRQPDSHKGNHGHALIIAGSKSKMGAAVISTKTCLRTGAGLVTVNIPEDERAVIFISIPEAMVQFREDEIDLEKYNCIAIGPGIGTDDSAEQILESLLDNIDLPIVFDADALNLLSKNPENLLRIPQKSILTPHPKEFDRLFGIHNSEEERRQTATLKAKQLNVVIIVKGHKTFITNGESNYENSTGNSGLAKGGSGDALTGIITAFLAQRYEPINAALLGVFLHGLAADITLETQRTESNLITHLT